MVGTVSVVHPSLVDAVPTISSTTVSDIARNHCGLPFFLLYKSISRLFSHNVNGEIIQSVAFFHDSLGMWTKLLMLVSTLGCVALSRTYIKNHSLNTLEYSILLLLSVGGQCILVSSGDLLAIYLSVELQSLCFYVIASSQTSSAFGTEAGLKYFLQGALASAFLLLGGSFVYGFGGSTSLSHLGDLHNTGVSLGIMLFSWGLLFKIGAVPFHMWVPDVYEGAPTSVSMIFGVLPKISILVALIRLIDGVNHEIWTVLLSISALASLALGGLLGLAQNRTKRLLAYSSIGHGGFVLVGLACANGKGLQASLTYVVIYIITALFLWGLIALSREEGGRTQHFVDLQGWVRTNPVLGSSACLVIFSLAGIPPLGGFFAKWAIFESAIEVSLFLLVVGCLLTSLFSLIYYLRVIKALGFEDGNRPYPYPLAKNQALVLGLVTFFLVFFVNYGELLFLSGEFFSML